MNRHWLIFHFNVIMYYLYIRTPSFKHRTFSIYATSSIWCKFHFVVHPLYVHQFCQRVTERSFPHNSFSFAHCFLIYLTDDDSELMPCKSKHRKKQHNMILLLLYVIEQACRCTIFRNFQMFMLKPMTLSNSHHRFNYRLLIQNEFHSNTCQFLFLLDLRI